ncbi:MAG: hypothetical protein K2R98_17700 [Gemmataceae bacterium]|nr:hypothetical protein [Gemmataceae bacterium]
MFALMYKSVFGLRAVPWLLTLTLTVLASTRVAAQPAAAEQSAFITVNNPITDKVTSHVKTLTERIRQRHGEALKQEGDGKSGKPMRPLVIVYDFNPDKQPSSSPLYGSCRDLAAYLRSLNDVVTVAFVHKDVSRHTVLPVLACKEIVMASGDHVRLGHVLPDDSDQPPRAVAAFYKDDRVEYYRGIAEQFGRCPAVVLKMLDKNLEVRKAKRVGDADWWVDPRLPRPDGILTILSEVALPAGSAGFYGATSAKNFGLISGILQSRQEVAQEFRMPPSSLREDPLEGRAPKVWRVVVDGVFDKPMEERVRRRINRAIGQGANFLILELACGNGDPIIARDLADYIHDLKDNAGQHHVMTVAYVTPQSSNYALFLALSCTEIVMNAGARLGDFERVLQTVGPMDARQPALQPPSAELLSKSAVALAERRDYPAALIRGMVERDLIIHHAHAKKNPSVRRFLTEDELRTDREGEAQWVTAADSRIKDKDTLLVLDAGQATELGLSRHTAPNVTNVYQHFGLEEGQVRTIGPDWFEEFAGFLRLKIVAVILVMLGITCLILELKLPGIGLPGIVSALCFILFFWAHAGLAFTWLAVLLFILGLVLIALEIFVVPGVAVLGVSGVVLLLASLGLATMERWPQTEADWVSTGTSFGNFGLALIGAVFAAIVVARYLPSIPYANRLVLVPPSERAATLAEEATAESNPHAALLGAIGVAATTLRPAGMVRFGDEFVDVVAEGSYIPPGNRVQVIEIEGHRIVVKEV